MFLARPRAKIRLYIGFEFVIFSSGGVVIKGWQIFEKNNRYTAFKASIFVWTYAKLLLPFSHSLCEIIIKNNKGHCKSVEIIIFKNIAAELMDLRVKWISHIFFIFYSFIINKEHQRLVKMTVKIRKSLVNYFMSLFTIKDMVTNNQHFETEMSQWHFFI